MERQGKFRSRIFNSIPPAATAVAAFLFTLVLSVAATQTVQAQTLNVIHTFTGLVDGGAPIAGLTTDGAGNFYGTAANGGYFGGSCALDIQEGCGTVYQLTQTGSGWLLRTLYVFHGGMDGAHPAARVVFGPDGNLYGTTAEGGGGGCNRLGCGTVFRLSPPAPGCQNSCLWTETVLYRFRGTTDGREPTGDLIVDQAGNLYGTTAYGGYLGAPCPEPYGCGVVYELTPSSDSWTETVIYKLRGAADGFEPHGGVIFDQNGNLYGTASSGGAYHYGVVFQLTLSGSQWTENTIYSFQDRDDGGLPYGGLTLDGIGNLYGTAEIGGPNLGGTVFELTQSGGAWSFKLLYGFSEDGSPGTKLFLTPSGNVYGSTWVGGSNHAGNVFELTPSGGGWNYRSLHDFIGTYDGSGPSAVVVDANGNVYGTSQTGEVNGWGHVFEITP
jgi:uncharacterized repeat protein (TIGR03803 family)